MNTGSKSAADFFTVTGDIEITSMNNDGSGTFRFIRAEEAPGNNIDVRTVAPPDRGSEADPTKYDTFTYSGAMHFLNSINLNDLPKEMQTINREPIGSKPDPNIVEYIRDAPAEYDPSKKYWGYELEADNPGLDRYFFTADFDFLYKSAEEYAKIESHQDYDIDPTESSNFIYSLRGLLDGKNESADWDQYQASIADIKHLQSELKGVAREIAERMKNGESTDLESLTSTITIKGAQFTMSEIKELQKDLQFFAGLSLSIVERQGEYASLGLAKTAGNMIADKYADKSEEFSNALKASLNRTVDEFSAVLQARIESRPNATYYNQAAKTGLEAEKLFAGIDTSSKDAAEQSYQEIKTKFSAMLDEYFKMAGGFAGDSKSASLSSVDRQFKRILDYIYS